MTSISTNLSSVTSSTHTGGASDSLGKKITELKQKVQDLYKQARELKDTKLSQAEKEKQQQIIQSSIQMLLNEISRLEQERASKGKQGGTEPGQKPEASSDAQKPQSVSVNGETVTKVDDFA